MSGRVRSFRLSSAHRCPFSNGSRVAERPVVDQIRNDIEDSARDGVRDDDEARAVKPVSQFLLRHCHFAIHRPDRLACWIREPQRLGCGSSQNHR
jgi:hypothetical protein